MQSFNNSWDSTRYLKLKPVVFSKRRGWLCGLILLNTLFQLWVVHPKFNYILCKGEHLLVMEREEIILTQKYFPHSRSRSCGQSFKLNIESPCDGCGSGSQYPIRLSLLLSSSPRPGSVETARHPPAPAVTEPRVTHLPDEVLNVNQKVCSTVTILSTNIFRISLKWTRSRSARSRIFHLNGLISDRHLALSPQYPVNTQHTQNWSRVSLVHKMWISGVILCWPP